MTDKPKAYFSKNMRKTAFVVTAWSGAIAALGLSAHSLRADHALRCERCMAEDAYFVQTAPTGDRFDLSKVNLSYMTQGYGSPHVNESVDGHPLTIDKTVYSTGVGTHAVSTLMINLNKTASAFHALVGVDDETNGKGAVVFQVWADGHLKYTSGVMHAGDAAKPVDVDLTGVKSVALLVNAGTAGIDFDHADWADAYFTLTPDHVGLPQSASVPQEAPRMVIPPTSPLPEIHGAPIVGATPHYPFLFRVPATGMGPLYYHAKGLPAGLRINSSTGIISGSLPHNGRWDVTLIVNGRRGHTQRRLVIVGGTHKLALTPPMGWNSWNVWAGAVDQQKMLASAKAMISSGLAAHGYQYVNIDDTWEGPRNKQGFITTNHKFPNMKQLGTDIHQMGLKFGIYSSPGPTTCAGYPASYRHELQDAESYAGWGVDYLKYDWCSYQNVAVGTGTEYYALPYWVMRKALDTVNRDILFSFCQYGMGDVWKWGARAGGNCWRTTGDINDSWGSLIGIINAQAPIGQYNGPGHWNDPDMLVVGDVGWGHPHPSHLTPNEQLTHISMWCMFSAPLLVGCDMTNLSPFTKAILTNDEVLSIDQDPMGKTARRVVYNPQEQVWVRPLADGSHAVALMNTGFQPLKVTATWKQLGLAGRLKARDLWLHKNVGSHVGAIGYVVPPHGVVLLKLWR